MEGFSQVLAAEVAGFGIKATLIEPGGYATDWGGSSAVRSAEMPAYAAARANIAALRGSFSPRDPQATAPAILELVDAAAAPLRLFLGTTGLPMVQAGYAKPLQVWEPWQDVSAAAQGNAAAKP